MTHFAPHSGAPDALAAALEGQRALHVERWPEPVKIRARIALHTGGVELRDGDYFGPPLNRVARLLAAAHGGQTLLLKGVEGKRKRVTLAKASNIPIRRHSKIKGEANPLDSQWEPYFEDRLGLKMHGEMKGKATFLRLWRSQNKRCTLCDQLITKGDGVEYSPPYSEV